MVFSFLLYHNYLPGSKCITFFKLYNIPFISFPTKRTSLLFIQQFLNDWTGMNGLLCASLWGIYEVGVGQPACFCSPFLSWQLDGLYSYVGLTNTKCSAPSSWGCLFLIKKNEQHNSYQRKTWDILDSRLSKSKISFKTLEGQFCQPSKQTLAYKPKMFHNALDMNLNHFFSVWQKVKV